MISRKENWIILQQGIKNNVIIGIDFCWQRKKHVLLKELLSEQRDIRKDLGYLLNSMLSSSMNVYLIIVTWCLS